MFCGVEVDVEASAAVVDEDDAVVGGVFVYFCDFLEVLNAVGEVDCEGFVEVLWVLWDGLVVDGGGWFEVGVDLGDGLGGGEICVCEYAE